MSVRSGNESGRPARVLLHSQRGLFDDVHYRLGLYEFENIVSEIDAVDLVTPQPTNWFPTGTRLANRLASDLRISLNPGIQPQKITKDYDLFFAVIQFPKDLLHVKFVDGWKQRCRRSVCWVNELWVADIPKIPHYLPMLAEFDHVILHWSGSVQAIQDLIGKPCSYLPYGIDTEQFCPYPAAPPRVVDVYSIGRRSERTHRALLSMAERRPFFYLFDTLKGFQVSDAADHRSLLAATAKRSRYFLVNPGKKNNADETRGQIEFGNRFFEGAAAGAIMLGETPRNAHFNTVFGWPDAVIDLPFDSEHIEQVIDDLDRQPARQEQIRLDNVTHSLRRHDWLYRWESILRTVGLDPLPALGQRRERLHARAAAAEQQFGQSVKA